eukprot:2665963-Rhodomonas_salina.1
MADSARHLPEMHQPEPRALRDGGRERRERSLSPRPSSTASTWVVRPTTGAERGERSDRSE